MYHHTYIQIVVSEGISSMSSSSRSLCFNKKASDKLLLFILGRKKKNSIEALFEGVWNVYLLIIVRLSDQLRCYSREQIEAIPLVISESIDYLCNRLIR